MKCLSSIVERKQHSINGTQKHPMPCTVFGMLLTF